MIAQAGAALIDISSSIEARYRARQTIVSVVSSSVETRAGGCYNAAKTQLRHWEGVGSGEALHSGELED